MSRVEKGFPCGRAKQGFLPFGALCGEITGWVALLYWAEGTESSPVRWYFNQLLFLEGFVDLRLANWLLEAS